MSAGSGTVDMGAEYGFRQQFYGDPAGAMVPHSTNDPLIISSGSVAWNIATATQRCPDAVAMYQFLGWSNTQITNLTLPTLAINNMMLRAQGGWSGSGYLSRSKIYMPAGVWHLNSEIRAGQAILKGDGSSDNYGQGGTMFQYSATNWKSLHGVQNNGVRILWAPMTYAGESNATPSPVAIAPGVGEWCHNSLVEDCHFNGTVGDFYVPGAPVQIAMMYYAPGEVSGPRKCYFTKFDVPVLVSHKPAEATVKDCSFFSNNLMAIGVRGCANSKITLDTCRGDMNPYLVFVFRGGTSCLGSSIGPFLLHASMENPGGNITINEPKVEAYACAPSGFIGGMSSCDGLSAAAPGKGQMLARFTGRGVMTINGATHNVHNGIIDSAVEVIDDYNAFGPTGWMHASQGGAVPLDNSIIEINNIQSEGVRHFLHHMDANRKVQLQSGAADDNLRNMFVQFNQNSGLAHDHKVKGQPLHTNTPASYRGRQPFINSAQLPGTTWNQNASPSFNYNVLDGHLYP